MPSYVLSEATAKALQELLKDPQFSDLLGSKNPHQRAHRDICLVKVTNSDPDDNGWYDGRVVMFRSGSFEDLGFCLIRDINGRSLSANVRYFARRGGSHTREEGSAMEEVYYPTFLTDASGTAAGSLDCNFDAYLDVVTNVILDEETCEVILTIKRIEWDSRLCIRVTDPPAEEPPGSE